MLKEALKLAQQGFYVFPCRGKKPLTENGCKNATIDADQIKKWWAGKNINIGIATGIGRRFFVLDKDVSKGKVGAASLAALEANFGKLPDTLRAITGTGGTHYYFSVPYDVGNGTDVGENKNLDVRGLGGYVIAPPSRHPDGGFYRWDNEEEAIAECPAWLLEMLTKKEPEKKITSTAAAVEILSSDIQSLKIEEKKFSKKEVELMLSFISPDRSYEDWFKIAASIKYCLGENEGLKVFDRWSKTAKEKGKYSSRDVLKLWASVKTNKGIEGGTLDYYAKAGGYLGSAVTNEDTADAISEIIEKFIYARPNESFYDLSTMERLNENQFNKTYGFAFKKGTATDTITRNKNFKIIKGITYAPGKEIFTPEKSLDSDAIVEKFNLWRPCKTERRKGDISPFLAHVDYLLPDPYESGILLDYLAFQVQFPGVKIHWAITIVGKPGIGKSYLELVMQQVLGAHNVHTLDIEHLHEQFTEWQSRTQFVIVHEMMARGRMELMGKLKSMITDPTCSIREMYTPVYKQPNRFNFLFFTNNKNSLLIEKGDRRHCILNSEADPHADEDKYYKPLFEWTAANGPALLDYLLSLDLSKFKFSNKAPQTKGREEMIEASLRPLDHFIKGQVDAEEYPFPGDLTGTVNLLDDLKQFGHFTNPKEIGEAFGRLGYLNLGEIRMNGMKGRYWAVRNFDLYRNMPLDQLRGVIKGCESQKSLNKDEVKNKQVM